MILADLSTLRDRLTEMAEAMGAKPINDAGLKAWLMALRDFPLPETVDALDTWLRTKQKMPVPADIRSILAARLSDRIESRAAADKTEFAVGASKILQRMCNPDVARFHLSKIHETLRRFCSQPHDPMRWARILKRKEESAEKLEFCQSKAWRHALGASLLTDAQIEANEERLAMQSGF